MSKKLFLIFSLCITFSLFGAPEQADAAIQLVGTTTASGTSSAYNMSLTSLLGGIGSAPAENDIVIILNVFANTTDGDPGVGTAGYTEIKDVFNGNDTNDTNLSVNYKIMTASPDTTVSCNPSSGTTVSSVCYALVFRGVDTTTPMDTASTSAVSASNGGDKVDCPTISPVTSGAYIVCTGGAGGTAIENTPWSGPAGYVNAVVSSSPTDPGLVAGAVGAYQAWDGSGAEDPGAWTMDLGTTNANSYAAVTMVLRPATAAPTVTTGSASGIISATLSGSVDNTGGEDVSPRGFAWGTSSTLQDSGVFATTSETAGGPFGTGTFNQLVSGLISGTTYYFRAYATNSAGTGYGSIANFTAGSDTSLSPSRKIRLFEGATIKLLEGNRIIIQ